MREGGGRVRGGGKKEGGCEGGRGGDITLGILSPISRRLRRRRGVLWR